VEKKTYLSVQVMFRLPRPEKVNSTFPAVVFPYRHVERGADYSTLSRVHPYKLRKRVSVRRFVEGKGQTGTSHMPGLTVNRLQTLVVGPAVH
jgi:hypothetical protein